MTTTAPRPSATTGPPAARRGGAPRRPWLTYRRRDNLTGFLMVSPQLLGSAAFVIGPLVMVVWYSLHEWRVLANEFTFVGAANYERLAADPGFHDSLRATGLFSLGLVVFNIALALALAVMLDQKLRGTTVFRTLFFSPVVVTLVAWTIVWGFLLQDNGGINAFLDAVGVEGPNWLRGESTSMLAVVVVQVLKNVGLNMVLFLAALQGVPEELKEAARMDGAGPFRVFRSITLALISPTILLVSIITVVGSLQVFAQIAVLTQGGPGTSTTVLVYYLYQQAFQFKEFGYASAVAVVLFGIVLVLTLIQWGLRRRFVFHES